MVHLFQDGSIQSWDPGLGALISALEADIGSIDRKFPLRRSEARAEEHRQLRIRWKDVCARLPINELTPAGYIDRYLLHWYLECEERRAQSRQADDNRILNLLPFTKQLVTMLESSAPGMSMDPKQLAAQLHQALISLRDSKAIVQGLDLSCVDWLECVGAALSRWADNALPYDPAIQWWCQKPVDDLTQEISNFAAELKSSLTHHPIAPIGKEQLLQELDLELIDNSPEELIEIAEGEYSYCLAEMQKAARELGFDQDWKAALERVKDSAVPPGDQPGVVRALAIEAIRYVEERNLLTIPELAKETWRVEMMSEEAQKVNPFFLGGEAIIVSYPTGSMSHQAKLMSARGNNPNFSRATVQHELIPGHHMQQFMCARYRPYRRLFSTPFWIEGWTLYWELLLWELGFPQTPEQRIGMLFWRMHRCVRIVFSLGYHLGKLSAEECVDMLVERTGHERANAEGEVRRSFGGGYPPLYQAAYLLGGLQFRAMSRQFVRPGGMTYREFHDEVMRQNEMPPSVLREVLARRTPDPLKKLSWRFDNLGV